MPALIVIFKFCAVHVPIKLVLKTISNYPQLHMGVRFLGCPMISRLMPLYISSVYSTFSFGLSIIVTAAPAAALDVYHSIN